MKQACLRIVLPVCMALGLAACGTPRKGPVPVEDRSPARSAASAAQSSTRASASGVAGSGAVTSPVGSSADAASNAGKPGYYTVKPGDSLIKIALENGQNWRDIARWNNIENPNVIEVGQVLRVAPEPSSSTARARPPSAPSDARPSSQSQPQTAPAASAGTGAQDPTVVREPTREAVREAARSSTAESPRETTRESLVDTLDWMWPASGPVLQGFDDTRNKGLDIGGKAGDPVNAAADGRVVYAGSALRGYGNLVIIKHNGTFLSAYAHNQKLLVKEDDVVKRGQRIAEMGSSDAERVMLHFEIRRDGRPTDPAKLLPAR